MILGIQLNPLTKAGLTVIAKVKNQDGSQIGADVALTETSAAYYFSAYDESTFADGTFGVSFIDTFDGSLVGTGQFNVKDGVENTLDKVSRNVWSEVLP